MNLDLKNKNAIVCGCTQGIGKATAIELATHPEKFKIIKNKLSNNLTEGTLFDTSLFTKNLEKAYFVMHERSQKGLSVEAIEVDN